MTEHEKNRQLRVEINRTIRRLRRALDPVASRGFSADLAPEIDTVIDKLKRRRPAKKDCGV